MWRTLPAHLFPFPGENRRSVGLSGTARSSRGSLPSPASRNSGKGRKVSWKRPRRCGLTRVGWVHRFNPRGPSSRMGGAAVYLRQDRLGPRAESPHLRPSPAPDSQHQRIPRASTVFSAANITCFARAIGTVLPSSFKQRLIRSLLRFSITLWETGVL